MSKTNHNASAQYLLGSQAGAVVDRLQAMSDRQFWGTATRFIVGSIYNRFRGDETDFTVTPRGKQMLADKLVALDPDKAALCYLLCRSLGARRVVEAGTSFGVSTIYLASAVRDNVQSAGGAGVVIGTEHEPAKAAAAQQNFDEAGVSQWIDLREGDLRETLKEIDGPVDFMLADIWIPMAQPALELVAPHMRSGAIVLADNTVQFARQYREYLQYVRDPANGFRSHSIPLKGGLEMSVRIV